MVTRATSFVQLLRRWLINPVIDFLYPPACLVCGVRVDGTPDFICPSCLSALTRLDDDHPVAREIRGRLREERVELVASVFLMEHGGGLQTLIHEMKYRGMKNVGVWFGELIGWRLTELPSRRRIDGIIPVPLHTVRKRERGFNQSDLISRGISRVTGIPVLSDVLRRTRYTDSQTKLRIDRRQENVAEAFEVRRSSRAGVMRRRLLIVDDVITTGSTLAECASALHAAGAQWVGAASAALVSTNEAARHTAGGETRHTAGGETRDGSDPGLRPPSGGTAATG